MIDRTPSTDPTEAIRRARSQEINREPFGRAGLEARYGRVWNTLELAQEFEVLGFAAPLVVVRRKADGSRGSLEFQHDPRFYFNYLAHPGA